MRLGLVVVGRQSRKDVIETIQAVVPMHPHTVASGTPNSSPGKQSPGIKEGALRMRGYSVSPKRPRRAGALAFGVMGFLPTSHGTSDGFSPGAVPRLAVQSTPMDRHAWMQGPEGAIAARGGDG